jgi:hypothetical protein
MRLFQNSSVYRAYRPRLARLTRHCRTFDDAIGAFLDDRFGAAHFLKPVLDRQADAFFANCDDERTQRLWAAENGLSRSASLDEILLAQIEHHRADVFYNLDPMRYGDDFLKRLPSCVRRTIAWRAAPSAGGRFLKHDLLVNNFPGIIEDFRRKGARAEYFFPAHDPAMDSYAVRAEREIDVLFVGTYSRHHRKRAFVLDTLAASKSKFNVAMHLDRSRLTALAETPLGWFGPLQRHRRTRNIRRVARPPVFGRDLLDAMSRAKIVINGAIDMSMEDRGNMRCWEALGCGALMLSDCGAYPPGFEDGETMVTYGSLDDMLTKLDQLIDRHDHRRAIARAGAQMVADRYSKQRQWDRFLSLL